MMRKLSCFAVGLALAVGAVSMTAAPATAATAHTQTGAVAVKTALAPACVKAVPFKGKVNGGVWIHNDCKASYRVKAIFSRGADTVCRSIDPGVTWKYVSGPFAVFDRLVKC